MSVPEARGGASPPSGSTSMVLRRRCRHGLAMLHISAQLHRQQLRPAVRHTAEYCHHARYSCRCRWCHCVRPCSWPWSTSVRKSFALLHVQLHHARDRSSRSAGARLKSRAVWWLNCHGCLDHQIRLWAECGVSYLCSARGEPYIP